MLNKQSNEEHGKKQRQKGQPRQLWNGRAEEVGDGASDEVGAANSDSIGIYCSLLRMYGAPNPTFDPPITYKLSLTLATANSTLGDNI